MAKRDIARRDTEPEIVAYERSEPRRGDRFITRDEVMRRVGVSYTTLWLWIKAGAFPAARELAPGRRARIGWLESEVDAWFANRAKRMPKGSDPAAFKPHAA